MAKVKITYRGEFQTVRDIDVPYRSGVYHGWMPQEKRVIYDLIHKRYPLFMDSLEFLGKEVSLVSLMISSIEVLPRTPQEERDSIKNIPSQLEDAAIRAADLALLSRYGRENIVTKEDEDLWQQTYESVIKSSNDVEKEAIYWDSIE